MIYLDSAATTFQKPPAVGRAMTEALASMSSPCLLYTSDAADD